MSVDFVNEPGKWMDEWMESVNNNSDFDEKGDDWGVGFNGNYIFTVEADGEIDQTIYNYAEIEAGEVHEVKSLSEDEVDSLKDEVGFVLRGTYDHWKELIRGEVGPIDGLMSGKFELDGDMQKVLQYSAGAAELAGASAEVDTEFPV